MNENNLRLAKAKAVAESIARFGTNEDKNKFLIWALDSLEYFSAMDDEVTYNIIAEQLSAYNAALKSERTTQTSRERRQ